MKKNNAKFTVTLESNKRTRHFKILQIFDNRICENVTDKHFELSPTFKDGFINADDAMESLNWCLNGDSSKYKIKYGQGNKETQLAYAHIFD